MSDGWSSRTRKSIINFMVYCDRSMIYFSSIDTTNISKTTYYTVADPETPRGGGEFANKLLFFSVNITIYRNKV